MDMEVQRLDGEVVSGRVASLSLDGSRWRSGGDSAFYCHTTAITRGAAHSINGWGEKGKMEKIVKRG